MKLPRLARRREILLPTFWGWTVIVAALAAAALLAVRHLYSFLAVTQPVKASVLVVEGWMDPRELDQAANVFRSGGYERLIATGGPLYRWPADPRHRTFADLAADYLRTRGLDGARIVAVPAPDTARNRTFVAAQSVREWARRSGVALEAFDLVSAGAHARRSRLTYELAFGPQVRVGVYAASPAGQDAARWWRDSDSAKEVLQELAGLMWVKCCFWP